MSHGAIAERMNVTEVEVQELIARGLNFVRERERCVRAAAASEAPAIAAKLPEAQPDPRPLLSDDMDSMAYAASIPDEPCGIKFEAEPVVPAAEKDCPLVIDGVACETGWRVALEPDFITPLTPNGFLYMSLNAAEGENTTRSSTEPDHQTVDGMSRGATEVVSFEKRKP